MAMIEEKVASGHTVSPRNQIAASVPSVEHRQHRGLNNRAENSHQPI